MEFALGVLHWTPAAFWSASPFELFAAIDGWTRANIPKKEDGGDGGFVTPEQFYDLMERFPDKKA